MLNLSRAMAYKNALAGLDHGGGKAVIIGDPATLKSEALLRAYGRFIESLGGRYITACDIGTYSEDMDIIARECGYVTGRTVPNGGAGDSSVLTAFGVFQGMRAAAEHRWGRPSLEGRAGRRGRRGQGRAAAGRPSWSRPGRRPWCVTWIRARSAGWWRRIRACRWRRAGPSCSPATWTSTPRARSAAHWTMTPWRPCGPASSAAGRTTSWLIPGIEKLLADRGVLYAPDYVVNAGGVIQVADERGGFNFERAQARAEQIFGTTRQIFALAGTEGVPPAVAADRLAERRMSEVGRLRGIWLGR